MPSFYAGDGTSFASSVPIINFTDLKEDVEEANYAPAFRTLADQFEYIRTRMPIAYGARLPETVSTFGMFGQTVAYANVAWDITNGLLNNSGGASGVTGMHGQTLFTPAQEGAGGFIDVPNCAAGDKILVRSVFVISGEQVTTGGTPSLFNGYLNLMAIDDQGGLNVRSIIPGTEIHGNFMGSNGRWGTSTPPPSFVLKWSGLWTVASPGTTKVTRVQTTYESGGTSSVWNLAFGISAIRFPSL